MVVMFSRAVVLKDLALEMAGIKDNTVESIAAVVIVELIYATCGQHRPGNIMDPRCGGGSTGFERGGADVGFDETGAGIRALGTVNGTEGAAKTKCDTMESRAMKVTE